ncbi:hypothetical protein [Streptomyces sp. DB-54]
MESSGLIGWGTVHRSHLCLLAPDADHGIVRLASCNDIAAERWKVVKP